MNKTYPFFQSTDFNYSSNSTSKNNTYMIIIYTQAISGIYDNFVFKFKNGLNFNFHELKLRFFSNHKLNRISIFQTFKILKLQSNYI